MQVHCECDLTRLIADGRKARRALQYAFGQFVELAYWTFERLIYLTPKSGRAREGDRVADSWDLKFQHYVLWREIAWSVMSDNEIIGYLEFGTRDHWVYPKIAKVLHWVDPVTGEDCFSAGHMVSGIKPVGMIRKTESEFGRKIAKLQTRTETKISN